MVEGDLTKPQSLLEAHPGLVHARSTPLHYVAANGTEGYRQKSPVNAAALLDADAAVDSLADLYDGQ